MSTYHSRTVEGMTGIPMRTIQAYIHDFREFFSEEARKPSKGRRFTDADIDKLQTIQRLRADRVPVEEIRKVLSGEVTLKLAHQFSETEVKNFAANALEYFENANDALRKANQVIREARAEIEQLQKEKELLRADYRALRDRVDQFKKWQIFVMKEIPELNPHDLEAQEKSRKGLLGLFGG
ncbi:MerR family transcriptional regulator [Chloroflexi bacterium CFX6]|nr:MerR family transcriptional regulator [Chloroflexi bacterium CFX6]